MTAFCEDGTMNWTEYFMGFARHAAVKSKDPSTQVGAVVIGPDGEIRSTGFNGLPRGVEDRPERMERPAKYLWTSHAEENAVAHAARVGVSLKDCTVYVTHFPCSRCARSLIQAGITAVVVDSGTTSMPPEEFHVAEQMFGEAGVAITRL
jgi:dCMP deaminase